MQAPEASSTTDGAGPAAAGLLPAGLGQQMGQQWQAGEATYLAGMAQVFALLRGERNTYPGHYAAVRSVYLTYLQRPAHNKQQKVCFCLFFFFLNSGIDCLTTAVKMQSIIALLNPPVCQLCKQSA